MTISTKSVAIVALGAILFGGWQIANSATITSRSRPAAAFRADSNFTELYNFGSNGYLPVGDLVWADGLIYGTAAGGGTKGNGIVFDITPAGAFNIVYAFTGTPDGSGPSAGVTVVDGNIYGPTSAGGHVGDGPKSGCGTLYETSLSGNESVLSRFGCAPELEQPVGKLLSHDGMLYGTTDLGGTGRAGAVFSATKLGKTTIVHSFSGADGADPQAGLVELNGTLYGTTAGGGANNDGTVFTLSSTGIETVLHSFTGPDGEFPTSLIAVNGTFYGTTFEGGAHGKGAVFSITPSGVLTVLYSFAGKPDGASPRARLAAYGGALYGTTVLGGVDNEGTVFKLAGGIETVLHNFGSNGKEPYGGMVVVNDALYGTTAGGGANGNFGTIFRLRL